MILCRVDPQPGCTDPTHSHSHSGDRQQTTAAARFGITTFVYSRRRPFNAARFQALLDALPFVRLAQASPPAALAELQAASSAAAAATGGVSGVGGAASDDENTHGPFVDVLRSKGFVWLSCESQVALYWSQAGRQIEVSEMGRWWAAVDRAKWPEAHIASILADCEDEWGDRRQELVFIGANLVCFQPLPLPFPSSALRVVDPVCLQPRDAIEDALDECLATDEEMEGVRRSEKAFAV